jgi:signal transduction histidine kinase
MRNIRSRLELFQGEVKFLSRPGEGCTLQAHFPLKANH